MFKIHNWLKTILKQISLILRDPDFDNLEVVKKMVKEIENPDLLIKLPLRKLPTKPPLWTLLFTFHLFSDIAVLVSIIFLT